MSRWKEIAAAARERPQISRLQIYIAVADDEDLALLDAVDKSGGPYAAFAVVALLAEAHRRGLRYSGTADELVKLYLDISRGKRDWPYVLAWFRERLVQR